MNHNRFVGAITTLMIALSQSLPVWSQTQQATYPAPELEGLGLIYDPLPAEETLSLSQIPGATAPGNIIVPDGELSYNSSRAWPAGATPDQFIKIGDLKENPQFAGFTKLRLKDFSQNIGTDIEGVPLKDIEVVNGVNLEQLKKLYDMDDVKVKDALPAVQLFLAFVFDPNAGLQQVKKNALSAGAKILINKLRKNPALKDVPFERILAGDWRGTILESEKILLQEIGDKMPEHLRRLPIGSLTVDIIEGDFSSLRQTAQGYAINEIQNLTIEEVTKRFPEIKEVPLAVVASIANQPLSQSLPKLADYTIEELGVEDKLLSSIPGLKDTPLGSVIGDILLKFLAGDVFARFDIAYTGQDGAEYHNGRPLSGGTKDQKFKPEPGIQSSTSKTKSPPKGMPRIEMKPAEGGSPLLGNEPILGKEWMTREQEVPGCKGILCVFGEWEPAGIKPVKDAVVKFSLGDLVEYDDKAFTARVYADFQVCVTMFFTQHCTAHIISLPTPWKITQNSLFPVLSRRRIQDLFPGINEQARTVDFCQTPAFLANSGQTDSPDGNPPSTQYGHHAFAETTDQLHEVTSVDGVKEGLTKEAAEAFEQMVADARAEGLDIRAVSGFRDKQIQKELFDLQTQQEGSPEAAAKVSAPPGYSEHHTGLAVDVGTNANPNLDSSFANTPEYAWLQENAGKYGFELSFPEGNSQGVSFEPWHWRYVGSEQAAATFSPAADDGHNHGTSTPADPDHNLKQYLARIAAGESTGGTNWNPNAETGAYGIYQFTPETRTTVLERTGLDGWSRDPSIAAQAAVEWIKIIGAEKGVDLIAAIQQGDFALADRVLSESQFTSLPGGPEQSAIWSNPENFNIYGPTGDASTNLPTTLASSGVPCQSTEIASAENVAIGSDGDGIATGNLGLPLPKGSYTFTDYFSHDHPDRGRPHLGVDLAAPTGTPVYSADGGQVDLVGWDKGYGNFIVVGHSDGTATLYAHLSEVNVRQGQPVSAKHKIGAVGSTGRSSGPHLHFEVIEGYSLGNPYSGVRVNPEKYYRF